MIRSFLLSALVSVFAGIGVFATLIGVYVILDELSKRRTNRTEHNEAPVDSSGRPHASQRSPKGGDENGRVGRPPRSTRRVTVADTDEAAWSHAAIEGAALIRISTESRVVNVLRAELDLEDWQVEAITEETTLADLGADDYDITYIMMDLEDEFGVEFTGMLVGSFVTVGDFIRYVSRPRVTQ